MRVIDAASIQIQYNNATSYSTITASSQKYVTPCEAKGMSFGAIRAGIEKTIEGDKLSQVWDKTLE